MSQIEAIEIASNAPPSGYLMVVEVLREKLLDGSLKVNDKLLPERELAIRLNVSRPVIREALRSLAMLGILEMRHGYGTVVRTPDASVLADFFTLAFAHEPHALDDIDQVRIALERQAITLACQRLRRADREQLEQAFEGIRQTLDEPGPGARADYQFHTAIVQAAHSPALLRIYGIISDLLLSSHIKRRSRVVHREAHSKFLIDYHRGILDAIIAGDESKAEKLLVEHFKMGSEMF